MSVRTLAAALVLLSGAALGHGLAPSRLEAPSGSPYVAYRFTASNYYNDSEWFEVECFKGDLFHKIQCNAVPHTFMVYPKSERKVKIQIPTGGQDGVYLACTIEADQNKPVVSRVCARIGVGVSPATSADRNKQHKPAAGAAVPARNGQNQGR